MKRFDTYNIEEVEGAFKKGMKFYSDSLVEFDGTDMTVAGATFSFSFWWKPTSTDSFTIFDSQQLKTSQIGDDLKIEFKNQAGDTTSMTAEDCLVLNTFQHFTIRKTSEKFELYKNKSLIKSIDNTDNVTSAASSYLKFIADNGVISDFKLYDKSLSDLEIKQDYDNPEPRIVDELLVYIPFSRASENLVTSDIVGGSSAIYGLDTTDFLYPVDISSISEDITYKTLVTVMESGYEQRRSVWTYPLYKWTVRLREKLIDDVGEIITFFKSKKGKETAFGWRCPVDGRIYKVRFDDTFSRTVRFNEAFEGSIELQEVR